MERRHSKRSKFEACSRVNARRKEAPRDLAPTAFSSATRVLPAGCLTCSACQPRPDTSVIPRSRWPAQRPFQIVPIGRVHQGIVLIKLPQSIQTVSALRPREHKLDAPRVEHMKCACPKSFWSWKRRVSVGWYSKFSNTAGRASTEQFRQAICFRRQPKMLSGHL